MTQINIDFNKFKFKFHRYYLIFIIGFLIHFQPSNTFNYEYLGTFKNNITHNNIGQDLYPSIIYSATVQSIFILFIIDLCNYTPLVIIYVISSLSYCCLLIWTDTLFLLQVTHVVFGSYLATDVVYLIYVFIFIDRNNYKKFATFIRIAPLLANAFAYLLSQLLITQNYMDLEQLHYISLAANIACAIVALFLPFPKCVEKPRVPIEWFKHFKEAFSDKYIIKWALWYSLSLSGYRLVSIYIQQLWKYNEIHDDVSYYNGITDGLASVFGIFGALIGGFNKLEWRYSGDLILTVTSLLQGFMLTFLSQITNQLSCCLFFVIFTACYYHTITSLTGELLINLDKQVQFSQVFGLIYCVSTLIQTIIIISINDNIGFGLNIKNQIFFYGSYHLSIAIVFIIIGLISWIAKRTYPI